MLFSSDFWAQSKSIVLYRIVLYCIFLALQTEETCRQLDAQLRDKETSIEQQQEEKENLTSKVEQLEQAKHEISRNLENKKLELQQLKEDAEKWKDKNVQFEQHIAKVFTTLYCCKI